MQAQSLRKYLLSYRSIVRNFDRETQEKLNKYFYKLSSISNSKAKGYNKNRVEKEEEILSLLGQQPHHAHSGFLDIESRLTFSIMF